MSDTDELAEALCRCRMEHDPRLPRHAAVSAHWRPRAEQ